jgi:putative salt-induced outer membrane protein YdiY
MSSSPVRPSVSLRGRSVRLRRAEHTARPRHASGTSLSGVALALAAAALVAGLPAAASAQDAAASPWRNQAEFSLVATGGNASTSTVGLRNTLRRALDRGELRFDVGALRTDAARVERRAVGTESSFQVERESETERTAERYTAQGRFDLNLSERTFGYTSAGWERNTFAGFNARTVLALGAGTRWERSEAWELKVGAALTYTFQDDVDPDPDRADRFAGLRGTLDHQHRLTTGTSLELKWVVDANAREWSDVRGDLSQSVSASLSDRLALKTTLQLLVDNDPPLRRVPLFTPGGEDTGATVLTPLRKMDRSLSVALVVTL